MNAIVVGGGIGGLTAVIALGRAGIEVDVYERAPELREVGAGISLWANAINALESLGIGGDIRARGLAGREAGLRTSDGTFINATSYEDLARRFGAALVLMHRADLLAILRNQIDPKRLHLGFSCIGFTQDVGGVRALFANGETAQGDLLVGADGLRSVVRAQLFGGDAPRYSGYTAWRAVVRLEHATIVAGESWGVGRRFGIVPLGDGRVYWYATHNEPAGGHDAAGARVELLKLFRGWHQPVEALIAACDDSSVVRNDIYDRDPLTRWNMGRVTLLGDAAHPMTPNLGQGGCQAIEDGVELAIALKESGRVDKGLGLYERRRIPRTSKVVLQSRRIGAMAQWENPILCGIRNGLMRVTPKSVMERQLDWLVGYQPVGGWSL